MKNSILIFSLICSSSIFAAEKYETHYRVIKEKIISIGECKDPITFKTWAPVALPSNSEVQVTTSTTTIHAKAYFNVVKCRTEETFKVGMLGSFWQGNRRKTEIPGSAKRVSVVVSEPLMIEKNSTIFEYKFSDISAEFKRVENLLNLNTSTECSDMNYQMQSKIVEINETACKK